MAWAKPRIRKPAAPRKPQCNTQNHQLITSEKHVSRDPRKEATFTKFATIDDLHEYINAGHKCPEFARDRFANTWALDETEDEDWQVEHPMICQCDHDSHFAGAGHDYLDSAAPAGARSAISVGPVCDDCAHAHMAHQLNEPLPGLDMKGQLQ